jgi:hypothetical protein
VKTHRPPLHQDLWIHFSSANSGQEREEEGLLDLMPSKTLLALTL